MNFNSVIQLDRNNMTAKNDSIIYDMKIFYEQAIQDVKNDNAGI